jgi:hypothetical protein
VKIEARSVGGEFRQKRSISEYGEGIAPVVRFVAGKNSESPQTRKGNGIFAEELIVLMR